MLTILLSVIFLAALFYGYGLAAAIVITALAIVVGVFQYFDPALIFYRAGQIKIAEKDHERAEDFFCLAGLFGQRAESGLMLAQIMLVDGWNEAFLDCLEKITRDKQASDKHASRAAQLFYFSVLLSGRSDLAGAVAEKVKMAGVDFPDDYSWCIQELQNQIVFAKKKPVWTGGGKWIISPLRP